MTIPAIDFKSWLTDTAGTGDGSTSQNNPDDSLGGWRSDTPMSSNIGNLFERYTQAELASSTRYRCMALTNANVTGIRQEAKMIVNSLSALKSGLSVEFGIHTNDLTTVAPTCTDTVAPVGVTFFSLFESTGDDTNDYAEATARPLGPLNADSDGTTLLGFDDSMVVFLYVKIICAGASGSLTNDVDNLITTRSLGTDSI